MTPILGIWASSAPQITYDFDSIATVTLTSNTSEIQFAAIPTKYAHLQFRIFAKGAGSATDPITVYGFDGTGSSSNSARHWLYGNGGSVFSQNVTGAYNPGMWTLPGTSNTSVWSTGVIDILDYTSTNKYKVLRAFGGYDANGTGSIYFTSVLAYGFGSSTALTNIRFNAAGNFLSGSTVALYGIKAA